MNYSITHTTSYRYSSRVNVCHNVLILEPRASAALKCREYRLEIEPEPQLVARRLDMFGNVVRRFSLEESHKSLTIRSISEVTVAPAEFSAEISSPECAQVAALGNDPGDLNWLKVAPFFYDSPRIRCSTEFADFAAQSLAPDTPILAAALNLTHQIYDEFKYSKDATRVDTPAEEAFTGRHGVCQDFAHIAIACLRSHGLAARYVSGYLRTIPAVGAKRLVGNDESHAWFSVYCGSEIGWVDFDPTNDCACDRNHVPIACGRDYSDVVPVKGMYIGGGKTTMSISVDVAPVGDAHGDPAA